MNMSRHTRLINMVIGLCKDTACWPSILHKLGYKVQLIEQKISLRESAQKIAPDVVAVSNRLTHAMAFDCKSGKNISSDQDCRYEALESRDLAYHITIHDPNQLTHVVCYADEDANHESLEPHTRLPFVTFGSEMRGIRDFGKKEVNDALCKPTSLDGMLEPTGHYPFAPDDNDSAIIPHVLPGLIAYLFQKGRGAPAIVVGPEMAESILKNIHPFHEQMSPIHRQNLTQKIENMIRTLRNSNSEFNQQLDKIEEGKISTSTMQSLRRICNEISKKYSEQQMLYSF